MTRHALPLWRFDHPSVERGSSSRSLEPVFKADDFASALEDRHAVPGLRCVLGGISEARGEPLRPAV